MNHRFSVVSVMAAFGWMVFQAQAQTPASQTPPPTADPYANNADAGKLKFPLAAPAGKDSGAITKALPGGVNQGMVDPATWKYGPAFDAAGRLEDLESRKAQDDERREGNRRHRIQFHRSRDLLRDGECRLRLHLDRDAARFARLGSGGAHVAHMSARQGGARRARGLRR